MKLVNGWHYIMTRASPSRRRLSMTIFVKLVSPEKSCARLPLNVILWLMLNGWLLAHITSTYSAEQMVILRYGYGHGKKGKG
jgi:hypothetical protein